MPSRNIDGIRYECACCGTEIVQSIVRKMTVEEMIERARLKMGWLGWRNTGSVWICPECQKGAM